MGGGLLEIVGFRLSKQSLPGTYSTVGSCPGPYSGPRGGSVAYHETAEVGAVERVRAVVAEDLALPATSSSSSLMSSSLHSHATFYL